MIKKIQNSDAVRKMVPIPPKEDKKQIPFGKTEATYPNVKIDSFRKGEGDKNR